MKYHHKMVYVSKAMAPGARNVSRAMNVFIHTSMHGDMHAHAGICMSAE